MPQLSQGANLPPTLRELVAANEPLVVVIEDEAMVLLGYQMLLEDWGYAVVAASSSEEALQALETAGRAPDAIISDYRLGAGKTGIDGIRAIRTRFGYSIPAVLVTGDANVAHILDGARIDVPVLAKPIRADALHDFLRRCLSGQDTI